MKLDKRKELEKKKQICILCWWLSTNSEESTVKLLEVITELSRIDEKTSNAISTFLKFFFFCLALSSLYSYLILSNRFTILNFFRDEENEGLRVKYFVHSYTAVSLKGTTGTLAIWHTIANCISTH